MAGCCHGNALEPPPRDPRFRRILWLALAVNGAMFLVQMTGSWFSGSMALQADALDFLGDSLSYAMTLAVLGMGLVARARAALFKGVTMAALGTWVLVGAVYRSWVGITPDAATMGALGLLALAANVGVAVALFRYRTGDSNMRSIWPVSYTHLTLPTSG